MFDQPVFEAWFNAAYFREGPPLTLVLASPGRCNWVRDQFGDKLRQAFGDDLVFEVERKREAANA